MVLAPVAELAGRSRQQKGLGPVVTIGRCSDEARAPARANDAPSGLAAWVWTRDLDRALRRAPALDCGAVWIDDHLPFGSRMPDGGFTESGYGRAQSMYAVSEYTEITHVMSQLS